MTTIARCVDDKMRRRRNVDKTMGTAQPPGRIRRWRRHSLRRMGVGFKGRRGGMLGRAPGGGYGDTTHRAIGVTVFPTNTRCCSFDGV